ncbi:hypothetical protein PPYR_09894, partial [Photinus pyralis]
DDDMQSSSNFKLKKKFPYRELVGVLTTRLDIWFPVNYLGQFNNCYGINHWTVSKRLLRYLKGTIDVGFILGSNSVAIAGFIDSNWSNNSDNRRRFFGYIFILNRGPLS